MWHSNLLPHKYKVPLTGLPQVFQMQNYMSLCFLFSEDLSRALPHGLHKTNHRHPESSNTFLLQQTWQDFRLLTCLPFSRLPYIQYLSLQTPHGAFFQIHFLRLPPPQSLCLDTSDCEDLQVFPEERTVFGRCAQ